MARLNKKQAPNITTLNNEFKLKEYYILYKYRIIDYWLMIAIPVKTLKDVKIYIKKEYPKNYKKYITVQKINYATKEWGIEKIPKLDQPYYYWLDYNYKFKEC